MPPAARASRLYDSTMRPSPSRRHAGAVGPATSREGLLAVVAAPELQRLVCGIPRSERAAMSAAVEAALMRISPAVPLEELHLLLSLPRPFCWLSLRVCVLPRLERAVGALSPHGCLEVLFQSAAARPRHAPGSPSTAADAEPPPQQQQQGGARAAGTGSLSPQLGGDGSQVCEGI